MRSVLLTGALAALLAATTGGCAGHQPAEPYAPLRHPFRGAALLVDDDSPAAHWRRDHDAAWLDPIVTRSQARWLTGPQDLADLGPVLAAARRQSALLVLVVYFIPDLDCAGPGAGAADDRAYAAFTDRLVDRLRGTRAVVVLEPDAVVAECFDDDRAAMLTSATRTLADAGHHVYLDAGHPRWRGPRETARRLLRSGIRHAEGFSVNVSNRQSTADSHRWGLELSGLVGDREMVIDTSRNGLPAPADDQWCNPARQGLGEPPTTDPGLDRVAALLWIKSPGESDGPCGHGDPAAGVFSPAQARTLTAAAPWLSADARRAARDADAPVT